MSRIRVGIADDQRLFRQTLSGFIRSEPAFELCLEAEDGNDCLQKLRKEEMRPDVLLLDMEMPGMNGIELNEIIHQEFPSVKVLVVSVYNRDKLISRMINSGASGYLEKNCDVSELTDAIQSVQKTGFYMNNTVLRAMQARAQSPAARKEEKTVTTADLTTREKEVLQLICREYSNAEIAEKLFISVRTAEGHRNNLLIKTGSRNTAGLVLYAIRFGFADMVF